MNLRRGMFFPVLLVGTVAGTALYHAPAVKAAGLVDSFVLPQRFLSVLPAPTLYAGFQTASAAKKTGTDDALPEGKGRDLAQKYCVTCHASTVWSKQRHTEDEWSSIIDNMVSKGLDAPDEDLDTITKYLATNFGPRKTTPTAAPSPDASPAPPPQ